MAAAVRFNHLDLFSGIGGWSVAAQLAELPVRRNFFSEVRPAAIRLHHLRHPESVFLGPVESIRGRSLRRMFEGPWIVTGSWPCQDHSTAGTRQGLDGKRSGLWFQMLRIIRELRPEWIVAENVRGALTSGFDTVLGSLSQARYDAEWSVISAASFGACHRRDRVWLVAYPQKRPADAVRVRQQPDLPVAHESKILGQLRPANYAHDRRRLRFDWQRAAAAGTLSGEPILYRTDDGLSPELHEELKTRITGLGNAIVPQVAAAILRRIASVA